MPLRLNLYHELHLQKKQEAYDPLKISILVLIITASVMAIYYFSLHRKKMASVSVLKSSTAEYKILAEAEIAAKKREAELTTQKANSEILARRIEERFYWPELLEDLTKCTTPKIQINKLFAEAGKENNRVQVSIEGLVASADTPRRSAEDFRTALLNKFNSKYKKVTAVYRKLDDAADTLQIKGETLKTANYFITLEFSTKDDPPPPTKNTKPKGKGK